jgi:pyruvate dehydrogenase E2 component (dihydrolipoamide acetyltransferase)
MTIEVKLPELGDGIESGDVLQVMVRAGDTIGANQSIIELETDKATVEVPSPQAGRVEKVLVSAGQTVPVGAILITLEAAPAKGAEKPSAEAPETKEAPKKEEAPKEKVAPRSAKPQAVAPTAEVAPASTKSNAAPAPSPAKAPSPAQAPAQAKSPAHAPVPAGPAIRRFARELGVDLAHVRGTGEQGRVTREDVLAVVRQAAKSAPPEPAVESAGIPGEPSTDPWGPVRVEPMSRVRKTIAAKMHQSWSTVPRVTNFDDADVTELEKIRLSSKADYAEKGIKLTAMPFLVKAVAMALKSNPVINAALDAEHDKIVYKQYVNVGIAVDTERGLVVPSLRAADRLSIPDIARGIAEMAEKARGGSFSLEELRGSTFTISNLGAIGGTYSTPIVNTPEVAILLVGRSRKMPVVVKDHVLARLMMPLSLSYDHRLVDGATAARFLNDVIGYLETPSRLLLAP